MSQRFLASCLRIEIDGANKQWLESRPAMSAACDKLDAMIDDVIRRYGASRQERLEKGAILAFIDTLACVEAAAALLFATSKEVWPTRTPLRVRIAVRTGMIESRRQGVGGQIVDVLSMQAARTFVGQATLCETTRNMVLSELPPDIDLYELGRVSVDPDRAPERLFSLHVAGVPTELKARLETMGGRHNIAARLTSFVGRESEIEELERRLRSNRLLTIVGPGGSGKTSLSRELGRHFAMELPDGAWFVPLADSKDEPDVYRGVWEALREVLGPNSSSHEALLDEIGDKSLLLVLDNLEQVLRPASRFVHKLLTFCPNVRVLATSRHSLGASGEQSFLIRPFAVQSMAESTELSALLDHPAVRLFVDRTRSVDPDFALTPENAEFVIQICRRVEGLPLAIEQVASNARKYSIQHLAKTLDESLIELSLPESSVEPRHATMRATVRWSVKLLPVQALELAPALLAFSDGWSLDAIESIARAKGHSSTQAMEAHGEWAESSLVVRFQVGEHLRFRFPEAVREALLELMPPTEVDTNQHSDYFFALALESETKLLGPSQGEWIQILELENSNLRAALRHVWERDVARAPRFVSALRRFWLRSRQHSEAKYWFENALSVTGSDQIELRATLLNALGACLYRLGQSINAERYYQESRNLWQKLENHSELGAVCTNLAMCRVEQNDSAGALDLSKASCREYEHAHDERGLGSALMNLGYLQAQIGDWDSADESLSQAIELLDATNHESHLSLALANQSFVAWKRGSRDAFLALVGRQIDLIERSRDATSFGLLALGFATCATEIGDTETVRSALATLHSTLGADPTFGSGLHVQQYQNAKKLTLPIGSEARVHELGKWEWDESIQSLRAIALRFQERETRPTP